MGIYPVILTSGKPLQFSGCIPVWTLLLARAFNKEKISKGGVIRVVLSVVGITLISGVSTTHGIKGVELLVPLFAGLMIAFWITLSSRASKAGASSLTISFYYDLFCFLAFCVLQKTAFSTNADDFLIVLESPKILFWLIIYSTAIGFLPNFLFYYGSKKVTAVAAGFVLLFEPVISSAVSFFIWGDHLGHMFVLGALFILSTNVPFEGIFKNTFRKIILAPKKNVTAMLATILVISSGSRLAIASDYATKELHFVEVVPPTSTTYNVTDQLREMEMALDLASADFAIRNRLCRPKITKTIKVGTEEELFRLVQSIGKDKKPSIVFGFSRSDFARIAAKALSGSRDIGLSVGASAPNLREINPNFYSMASPVENQGAIVFDAIEKFECKRNDSVGIFDKKSYLSERFLKQFFGKNYGTIVFVDQMNDDAFVKLLPKTKCIFIALNFSEAQTYLGRVMKQRWSGLVFGTGDWNIYSAELLKVLKQKTAAKFKILVPTGWLSDSNSLSKSFSRRMTEKLGQDPSPISAYTYDATILALESACGRFDIALGNSLQLRVPSVLRPYSGVSIGGNYVSKMWMRTFSVESAL